MTQSTDECVTCGEATSSGPLYSDRRSVTTADGDAAWQCSFCAALAKDHRNRKPSTEPVGTQQYIIPTHIPFFG